MKFSEQRIQVANRVLHSFSPKSRIEIDGSHLVVAWERNSSVTGTIRRRWITMRGQDFYPVWHHKWAHGGTACTALSQLVRWLQGRPVVPISSWRYWASDRCKLLPMSAVDALLAGGYPDRATCVLCGVQLHSMDWWHLDGISGPCCHYTEGCRQNPGEQQARQLAKAGAA